ncbi:unnamed protein product [Malus baccata var. baccata]
MHLNWIYGILLFDIQLHIISIFSCNFCLSFGIVEQDNSYLDSYIISTIGVEFIKCLIHVVKAGAFKSHSNAWTLLLVWTIIDDRRICKLACTVFNHIKQIQASCQ